jgi:TRAP-type C4-dicarboxylate transport system permease small subunit
MDRVWKIFRSETPKAVQLFLLIGVAYLMLLVLAIFGDTVHYVVANHRKGFTASSQLVISNVLLIFIVVELIEIARFQISRGQDLEEGDKAAQPGTEEAEEAEEAEEVYSPYLSKIFLRMLLIVGILSSIRHLLVVGADLTTELKPPATNKLWELAVTAGIALLLVVGLILLSRLYENPRKAEAKPWKEEPEEARKIAELDALLARCEAWLAEHRRDEVEVEVEVIEVETDE